MEINPAESKRPDISESDKIIRYFIPMNPEGKTYDQDIYDRDVVVIRKEYNKKCVNLDCCYYSFSKRVKFIYCFLWCEWIDPQGNLIESNYWPKGTLVMEGTQPRAFVAKIKKDEKLRELINNDMQIMKAKLGGKIDE